MVVRLVEGPRAAGERNKGPSIGEPDSQPTLSPTRITEDE
jgi:hypothetical protein